VWPLVSFLLAPPVDDRAAWERVMTAEARPLLEAALDTLAATQPFDPDALEAGLQPVVERAGVKAKALYQPLRVAITGTTVSPGIFDSLAALGRDEAIARVDAAVARISEHRGRSEG
jgi:glutamyl-tRNA synthetase